MQSQNNQEKIDNILIDCQSAQTILDISQGY